MCSKLKISALLFLIILSGSLSAQDYDQDSVLNEVLLRKNFSAGIILHNLGLGVQFHKGKNITYYKSFFWEIQAVSMKSPKQIRTINPYYSDARSFVYGKLNHVYILRGGIGFDRMLNRKPAWGGVEIRYLYSGGFSLGIAKPIYLYIINQTGNGFQEELQEEKYDPEKHFLDNIYGRAPFILGMNEMRFYPGLYGKFGLDFEFGVYNSRIKALEIGAIVDLYPVGIPVMAFQEPRNIFITLYLNFSIGRRYNRASDID